MKIYVLIDPRNEENKVIGATSLTLSKRLSCYVARARYKRKAQKTIEPSLLWVLDLLDSNLRPKIQLLEECTNDVWPEREKFYIRRYSTLLNVCKGGNGNRPGNNYSPTCGVCGSLKTFLPSGILICKICAARAYKKWQQSPKGRLSSQRRNHRAHLSGYRREWKKRHLCV